MIFSCPISSTSFSEQIGEHLKMQRMQYCVVLAVFMEIRETSNKNRGLLELLENQFIQNKCVLTKEEVFFSIRS